MIPFVRWHDAMQHPMRLQPRRRPLGRGTFAIEGSSVSRCQAEANPLTQSGQENPG